MDWVNQNKFRNWLIVVLLAINLITVSVLWMQSSGAIVPHPKEQGPRASESVNLMKRALQLTDAQAKQFDTIRTDLANQSKTYNDRMDALKRQLSEELFAGHPDTAVVYSKAKEIGELQAKIESIRFLYFNELLAICTPEQKDKLKPIVTEFFGRRPPKDDGQERAAQDGRKEERPARENDVRRMETNRPPAPRDDRAKPPGPDEKLARLSERLNLSDEQAKKIRSIVSMTRQKDEKLRSKSNPNPNEIQTEKDRNRKEEDEAIMKILNPDQRREYERMMQNRRK